MFDAFLDQQQRLGRPGDTLSAGPLLPGLHTRTFSCAPGKTLLTRHLPDNALEFLFLLQGSLELTDHQERHMNLRARKLLLVADVNHLSAVRLASKQLQGVLVVADLPTLQAHLTHLSPLLGAPAPDLPALVSLLRRRGGCVCLQDRPWTESLFSLLAALPKEELPRWCGWKALELLTLLPQDHSLLAAPFFSESYYSRRQVAAVRQAHDYMLAHLDEAMTIDRLAAQFSLSSTMLKACFRSQYGKPIHQYLRDKRLNRAAELLQGTTLPIAQISLEVGYASVSQFGAAFRRFYHTSPSDYRAREFPPI